MMWKLKGRAALLTCALLATGLALSSCGTSTLGYLYVTSVQYGQALSFRLNINNGKIGGTNCSVANAGQQTCNNSSGGANPTKLVLADGNQYMYVLNQGTTSPPSAGNIGLMTLGGSGSVYSTGQTFASPNSGQNPIDLYLGPAGTYLYVLYQYQPAFVSGCANPTPTTCAGAIALFTIGGNGNLTVQPNGNKPSQYYFETGYLPPLPGPDSQYPITGYGGNHFYAASGNLYLLDNSLGANFPEVHSYSIAAATGQLTDSDNVATQNPNFTAPVAIAGTGASVFIADAGNGAIWTYTAGTSGNGSLGSAGQGYFCPANPTYPYTTGGRPTQAGCASANGAPPYVIFASLLVNGANLYAADNSVTTGSNQTGNIYAMTFPTSGSNILGLSAGPNPVPLGTSVTCMTVSTGTPFLYVSGNNLIAGEQINTQTGNLSTRNNPTTSAPVQGYVPCLMYSSRR